MQLKHIAFIALICLFGFTACKNDKNKASETFKANPERDTVHVLLTGNDKKQYNISQIEVYDGQTVVLVFKHVGTAPKGTMGHNFTLLEKGTSVPQFAMRVSKLKQHDYLPKNGQNIIAHTRLLGGGQSDTITFKAPEIGSYDYLCTFPGHHTTMKGKFIVH